MIDVDNQITVQDLKSAAGRVFEFSGEKILAIEKRWNPADGTPVFTVSGKYTTRGWTEWTQGFQFGSAILQFDATGDERFLRIGREKTLTVMAAHVTHIGVHDHGFNNVSTYGNLLRLMREGRVADNEWERHFYELALKCSGAVQASRWTRLSDSAGYIRSFNGAHSLFADTIRSLRALAVAHQLGHALMAERDERVSLLARVLQHAETTARYNVFFGSGRDAYDVRGRVAHESVFNLTDGSYRCPNSQQGFSPFTTWTRGLAWIMLGFAEQLEFLQTLADREFAAAGADKAKVLARFLDTARATADFYIEQTPADGVPYWDTGAPLLHKLGADYLDRAAEPYNDWEPVDSSAAAIAAQGLLRLGNYLGADGDGKKYYQAALTVARTLFSDAYLSTSAAHEGLILHSVYHRPNGWDIIPQNRKVPCDESSLWGDYHARELALMVKRAADRQPYYKFFL